MAQAIKIMRLDDIPRGAKLVYPDGSEVVEISPNTLRQYAAVLAAEPIVADYLEHRFGPAELEEAAYLAIAVEGNRYLGAKLILEGEEIHVPREIIKMRRKGVSAGIAEGFTEKQIDRMFDVMNTLALQFDKDGNIPIAKIVGEWGEVIAFLDEDANGCLCLWEELPDDVRRLCEEADSDNVGP